MIIAAQLRGARGLLDLSREELADASNVSVETIKNLEHGRFKPEPDTANRLRLTFMRRGVGFFDVVAHVPLWGVILQPAHAQEQDNWQLTGPDSEKQERLSLVDRMAATIAATIRQRGQCRPRDLESQGFTADEIASAWLLASTVAELMRGDE